MEFDEAMKVLRTVAAAFQGNLQDHQTIQQALKVVEESKCKCANEETEN